MANVLRARQCWNAPLSERCPPSLDPLVCRLLAVGPRGRAPGLRREEVAQLTGMSVDYYTRLEQRRGP